MKAIRTRIDLEYVSRDVVGDEQVPIGWIRGDSGRLGRVGQRSVGVEQGSRKVDRKHVRAGIDRHLVDFRIRDQQMLLIIQVRNPGGVGTRRRELPRVDDLYEGSKERRRYLRIRSFRSVERQLDNQSDRGRAGLQIGCCAFSGADAGYVQAQLTGVIGGVTARPEPDSLRVSNPKSRNIVAGYDPGRLVQDLKQLRLRFQREQVTADRIQGETPQGR